MIEETAHVIGKSQSMSEERVRMDEGNEGDEGKILGRGMGWQRKRTLICLTQKTWQQTKT